MVASPPSPRESPNSQGPSWLHASGSSQAMPSPASTLPVSALVHLTHITASAENPSKPRNMSSRFARYTPKHGGNSSCHYRTPFQSQLSSARRKEARRWETSWERRRLVSDRGGAKPHRKRKRRRITDNYRGRTAPSNCTQNTPIHNT